MLCWQCHIASLRNGLAGVIQYQAGVPSCIPNSILTGWFYSGVKVDCRFNQERQFQHRPTKHKLAPFRTQPAFHPTTVIAFKALGRLICARICQFAHSVQSASQFVQTIQEESQTFGAAPPWFHLNTFSFFSSAKTYVSLTDKCTDLWCWTLKILRCLMYV